MNQFALVLFLVCFCLLLVLQPKKLIAGWRIFKDSLKVFWVRPILSLPLFICWLIYAPTVVYLKFYFPWKQLSTMQTILVAFLVILFFSVILSVSCLFLLEMIQQ